MSNLWTSLFDSREWDMKQNASETKACVYWCDVKLFIEGTADLPLQARVTAHLVSCEYCTTAMEAIEARFEQKICLIQDLIAASSSRDRELNSVPIDVNERLRRIGKHRP